MSDTHMASETLLDIRNLQTGFALREGYVKAVDGASFSIRRGETIGVVGESGCGKSITARTIMRIAGTSDDSLNGQALYRKSDGTVVDLLKLPHAGKEIRSIRGAEIAMIFQEPMTAFSPVHTIGNQIVEAIRLHQPLSKQEAREVAIEMLRRVEMSNAHRRIDAYPHQLSGGMRQRAMIAMALVCRPQLLLADEPTTALDVTTQAQILALIRQLKQDLGMSVMMITHDLGVVAETAQTVVVMYLGKVVEMADVRSLFRDPKHPYTRALLASIPKLGRRSGEALHPVQGMVPSPFNRPVGCPFHTRCPSAMPGVCDTAMPRQTRISDQHTVSCFLYDDNRREQVA
ncbi:dipeptide/oligopeptide/nickel ABC transporter ATP-binding protein [Devosia yakushimensis]|uniref:Dipeptide/oligopeptide/nickel ABC transporter ATP-binding protein n=1 Tax=Devosia yakushimensis TaxID=470028 RepID=A0ABQ5UC91_9HYPH|nr:ABC transporter ATP-binding protein [Devosia yakushimensis]GLQ08186.1 dipeptide/oligopeptide/nickel ABC transporter ATP-binding protein [Devosia yakushimensis]